MSRKIDQKLRIPLFSNEKGLKMNLILILKNLPKIEEKQGKKCQRRRASTASASKRNFALYMTKKNPVIGGNDAPIGVSGFKPDPEGRSGTRASYTVGFGLTSYPIEISISTLHERCGL